MQFDPFKKPLEKIVAADLLALHAVAEGWYIEYKRQPIEARNFGKAICAFANHYGGWLIVGVDAPQRTPLAFPGLTADQLNEAMDALRQAAIAHSNPAPHFECKEVSGPESRIGLSADRSILVVKIPPGQNPPYIHSSGRIYRRVADASDPKPESDRAILDLLVKRSSDYRKSFRRRIKKLPELDKSERKQPYLQMFLTHDPWGEQPIERVLTLEEFAQIVGTNEAAYSVPMECVFPTSNGFCARQVGDNDPYRISLTLNTSFYGFSEMLVPLRALTTHNAAPYMHSREFFEILPESLRERVIDVTLLWVFVGNALRVQDDLARAIGLTGNARVKLRFCNLWRQVPFVDTPMFVDHVRSRGIPVLQKSVSISPPGLEPDDMMEIDTDIESDVDPKIVPLLRAAQTLFWLMGSVGLPQKALVDVNATGELHGLLERAVSAHALR